MTSDGVTVRPNTPYRLNKVPLGEGTFSQVYRAQHRMTGEWVALKRAKPNQNARNRIHREIDVQRLLAPHPNIMPILDQDPGFQWYTMPIARGTLKDLRDGLNEDGLASIIADLAGALEAAHHRDLVHRDISPMNILALDTGSGHELQWVVADWGMVRRPYGTGSPRLTRTGVGAGTPGFDAPELFDDAQNATPAADVYSLGRIAAWFLTGKTPAPGHVLLPEGPALHWRMFVKACTENNLAERVKTMPELRNELTRVFTLHDEPPALRIQRLLNNLINGNAGLDEMMSIAAAYSSDADLYLDHVARVPTSQIRRWVPEAPALAAEIAGHMARHLRASPWKDRDREYVATPLIFIFTILQALMESEQFGPALDVAPGFFAVDAAWEYQPQRLRTVQWLSGLQSPADTVIVRALSAQSDFVDYYRTGLTPRSLALKAIFHV